MIADGGERKSSHGIAALIDHTLLTPEARRMDVERLCEEALRNRFATVCVNPVFCSLVVKLLSASKIKTCTVIGFPLGANLPTIKLRESQLALDDGAQELDMVLHIGGLKAGDDAEVGRDIEAIVHECHRRRAICKVILETSLLTDDEKKRASRIARDAGADFLKTSTGFSTGGATIADILLMRAVAGSKIGIKASGGIRTLDDLLSMVAAGATRIGASSGVKIMEEANQRFGM